MQPYNPITREQYFALIKAFYDGGLTIMDSKNKDYASENDPFKNFRMSESLNIKPEVGILIRMQDKMSRIGNLLFGNRGSDSTKLMDALLSIRSSVEFMQTYGLNSPEAERATYTIIETLSLAIDNKPLTPSVKDESIHDTLIDLANYSAILSTYLQTQKKNNNN